MISCRNVSKSFRDHKVLNKINFDVPEGVIVGLLGPSGAGKTTLIKILTGQLLSDEGKVEVMDRDVTKLKGADKNRFGIMMDQFGFYERFTCSENLKVFADIYGIPQSKVTDSLKDVGLEGASKIKASDLSKGMKARLLLARALMHSPKIIFLDEPTSGLDPKSMRAIHEIILKRKKEGCTVFLTTHNMDEAAMLCDNVMLLNEGTIVENGSPEELCRKYNRDKKIKVSLSDGVTKEFKQMGQDKHELADLISKGMIETIHSEEPTLETIFLELTGKKLQED
ncbi:MAG: ABC transporter ATP-binding protein [Clostridiales bacterium]|nr:ABC transporter ATP-binding protein [Clostridiales bacterium]